MFNISDNVKKINLINRRLFIVTTINCFGLSARLYSLQVKQKQISYLI